jgi:putative transposase
MSAEQIEKPNPITVTVSDSGEYAFHGRSVNITRDKNRALEPYRKVLLQYGKQLTLLPTEGQALLIRKINGCSRVVARDYLDARQAFYHEIKGSLTVSSYKKDGLKRLKEEKPWLREVDKFALEAAVEHIDAAFTKFFREGSGFPRYPSKYKPSGNRYTTKQTNGNIRLSTGKDGLPYIKLPKLGDVRYVLPKGTLPGTVLLPGSRITSATVIKDGRNYLVSLQLEAVIDKTAPVETVSARRITGLDLGIKEFAVYGDGSGERIHVRNERFIKLHEKRLRRFQRMLSRRKYDRKAHKGSKNYYKAKDHVAKEQRKTVNQRKDFHHKLSRKIADSCDVFVCEDLNIKGLMKDRRLSNAIAGVGWGRFLSMVKYKVERKGGIFLKVSRWYPSTKTCTHCGYKNDSLTLNDRFWKCPECGAFINRDENAVDNLIKEGIRILEEQGILCTTA